MSEGEVCIPNIGPRQRRRRLAWGAVAAVGALALAAWLVLSGAPRPARFAVFPLAFAGALGMLQHREST